MKIERFEDIDAWKNARTLVNSVYKVCSIERFKKDYGLADQICRAAISVMANISEGAARTGSKEFLPFLSISRGSFTPNSSLLTPHPFRSIDTSAWTDDDKANFQTSLASLKTEIDNYLNTPASKNLA